MFIVVKWINLVMHKNNAHIHYFRELCFSYGWIQNKIYYKLIPWNIWKSFRRLRFLYFDLAEAHAAGLTDRPTTTHDDSGVNSPEAADTNVEISDARRVKPNVVKRRQCEIATPAESDANTAQQSYQLITNVLAAVETKVAGFPHAVNGSYAFWLS